MRCAVRNCGNNNSNENRKKWRYFHFPKDNPQLQKWIEFCERDALNTSTACICNEHFKSDDFERNMQYEFGFSRKNPTKLKPGSYPTVKGPQTLPKVQSSKKKRRGRTKKENSYEQQEYAKSFSGLPLSPFEGVKEIIEVEPCGFTSDMEDRDEISATLTSNLGVENAEDELIKCETTEEPDGLEDQIHYKLEIVDTSTNSMDDVEIIDAEEATYVRHLEHEVTSLRREVFFLKDERKKLLDVIQNLKETIRGNRMLRKE
ncbi:uncharacterized protein LOC111076779 [Drosophila obscura]|uniref:uncharacterized protein LOC111076779 n=1 Tax=Drosophila obscura TaxID=7282 RepID=UPI001BB142F0|nr:uncharacterized protein LOC111076779 [Drosophila obscura]